MLLTGLTSGMAGKPIDISDLEVIVQLGVAKLCFSCPRESDSKSILQDKVTT